MRDFEQPPLPGGSIPYGNKNFDTPSPPPPEPTQHRPEDARDVPFIRLERTPEGLTGSGAAPEFVPVRRTNPAVALPGARYEPSQPPGQPERPAESERPEELDGRDDSLHITVRERPSEPPLRVTSFEDISRKVLSLGEAVVAEAVVVGSSAVYAALGDDMRPPRDIDLTVSPGAYTYLREQPGWEEVGGTVSDGVFDIGTNWGRATRGELTERSWETEEGVRVASLPDVVAWKTWERGDPKDVADVEAIRDRLLDPSKPPLPDKVIADEIAIARSCLPENLRDSPDAQVAIELAANGLATVRTLYGDDRIGRPGRIVGELELPEYGVIAAYHNGFDLPDDMRTLQRHMDNTGASSEERYAAMAADTYSDADYGGGRKSDNPGAYDELRSANLLAAHATAKGYSPEQVARHREAVLGTTFDERTGKQTGQHHPDPVVRGVAGVDLQCLSEPDGVPLVVGLAVEDGMSARFSPDRTIGRAAAELGVRISSTDEGVQFVDAHSKYRPQSTPNGPTVGEAFANRFVSNAKFTHPETGYTPPDGWTLEDREMRIANAAVSRDIGERMLAGDLTAQGAVHEAERHREQMEARRR